MRGLLGRRRGCEDCGNARLGLGLALACANANANGRASGWMARWVLADRGRDLVGKKSLGPGSYIEVRDKHEVVRRLEPWVQK